MKLVKTISLLAISICMTAAFSSCENKSNPLIPEETADLIGELTSNMTLESGKTYSLTGGFHVKNGVTLTIEPGVTVIAKDDNIVDYILIEQGGKIIAEGTKENPIILTSELKEAGAWGGVHICGRAPINVTGNTSKSEIGDAPYGGDDSNDSSGKLKYIRLEYAGYSFSEEKEANGFTFYGVGNGTEVAYLQAYKGSDDGFEWFGGTVNCNYLVSTDNSDDSFDWTEGWCGKGQFWVAMQSPSSKIGYDCDCLIEADNHSKNYEALPISNPILSNLTLIGNQSETSKHGIRLRAGTHAAIYNTIISGKTNCISIETNETQNSLLNGLSILSNIHLSTQVYSKEGLFTQEDFLKGENNLVDQTFNFSNNYIGIINGGKNLNEIDSYFIAAPFLGAVNESSDWTKGWTK